MQKMLHFFRKAVIKLAIHLSAVHSYDNINIMDSLGINNAGYFRIDDYDSHTARPKGRFDYQLLFLKSGKGQFGNGTQMQTLTAGQGFLFYPGEPQYYDFDAADRTEVYWIHFGGTQTKALLKRCGLYGTHSFLCPPGFVNTVDTVITELSRRNDLYATVCCAELIRLLAEIARTQTCPAANPLTEEMCRYINEHCTEDTSNERIAARFNLSVSYFLKAFKRHVGISPQQYKTQQRIRMAQGLLINSDSSVEQIARTVGYKDSLYFSRVFKKTAGCCPTEFRHRNTG